MESFANGCEVDSWWLNQRWYIVRSIGKHAKLVVMDALGTLEVVWPTVAPELSGYERASITVVLLS